jgi:hypothetical protein
MPDDAHDWWPDEIEYREYLERERRLFAWCLVRFGGIDPETAGQKALERYPYEIPGTPYRGMIFHELSFDWAIDALFGKHYNVVRPELMPTIEQWREEFERHAGIRL